MNILETARTSSIALNANKIRTFLTMLGVIIGVMAVILLVSLGKGVQNYITDQFEQLGSNLLFVSPGKVDFGRDPAESLGNNKLAQKHIDLIERYASEYLEGSTPYINLGTNVNYRTKSFYASLFGMSEEGLSIMNFSAEEGRIFTRSEVRAKSKVVILGPQVVKEIFPSENPIGKTVKMGDDSFEVIGVFESKGQSFDEGVLVPHTTTMEIFNLKNFSSIAIKVKSPDEIDTAIRQIEKALLRDLDEDEFTVLSAQDILSSIQDILGILTLGLGAIAAISLLVGGIGIMNIMLVSVTERTREIGLRKALGARPSDIATQFLIESTMLSVGGGIIGIVLGWGGSLIARNFLRAEVPWWSVLLAFSFAAFVGIIFGTYPAIQAAKKDPIDALRYE